MGDLANLVLGAWDGLTLAARMAVIAWVGTLISLPVVTRMWGDRATRRGVSMGVVLQATTVIFALSTAWGWGRTAATALSIAALGWGVEFLGSRTGLPFGRYHYTDRLQPQLGRVPLLIPLAWLMMLPPAWAISGLIAGEHGFSFVVLSALAFTAWDLFLDPQMVGWRLWAWERPRGYFGIPWTNYLGWVLASGVITLAIRPSGLPTSSLALVYAITWILETIGLGVFWRQPGPAICGFFGMGALLAWSWLARAGS